MKHFLTSNMIIMTILNISLYFLSTTIVKPLFKNAAAWLSRRPSNRDSDITRGDFGIIATQNWTQLTRSIRPINLNQLIGSFTD